MYKIHKNQSLPIFTQILKFLMARPLSHFNVHNFRSMMKEKSNLMRLPMLVEDGDVYNVSVTPKKRGTIEHWLV